MLAIGNAIVGTHNTCKTSNYNNEDYTQKRGRGALKLPSVPQYCLYVLFLVTVTKVYKTGTGTSGIPPLEFKRFCRKHIRNRREQRYALPHNMKINLRKKANKLI